MAVDVLDWQARLPVIEEEISMSRRIVAMTLVLVWLTVMPLPAATQEATPDAAPIGSGELLDLPALVLTPADLEAAGFPGYGLDVSTVQLGPALMAAGIFQGMIDDEQMAVVTEELRAAGAQQLHTSWLSLYDAETGALERDILLSAEEYQDAAGAEAGFDVIETLSREIDPSAQDVAATRTFGDGSELVLYGQAPEASSPIATPGSAEAPVPLTLNLPIRLGAMNVGVSIIDYTRNAPSVADVETLAETLVAKIETARGQEAPGLSFHALRLDPAEYSFDTYVVRDGVTLPYSSETEEERRVRAASYGPAADAYFVGQFVAAGEDGNDEDDYLVQNLVARFPDETAAADYIAELPALFEANAEYGNVTVRADGPDLGDESVAFAYTQAAPEGGTYQRERVAVRDGAEVTTVIVRTLDSAPPVAAVDTLAAAALECLDSEGWCPLAPVPVDLVPQATPVP
jgi:hypothetical protein